MHAPKTFWSRPRFAPRFGAAAAVLALALAACNAPADQQAPPADAATHGSCALGLAASASAEEAIRAVLLAEGELVVKQDIDALMQLWVEDGRVVDAKNTPDNDADNQNWEGKDAIRHRYVRTVFPGAPNQVQPSDLDIAVDGDKATVVATTHIGSEVSPAGDRWELARVDGCWMIRSLTYNLEPRQ